MIAAPVQCDIDGVPKGSHFARVPPMGYTGDVSLNWDDLNGNRLQFVIRL
jgi:hypothetical protein